MKDRCFAAVDMGTNSFHMVIVQHRKDGSLKLIDREKEVIRLGSQKGTELNSISERETNRAVEILSNFKRFADFYHAEFKAVATSAVREAENRNDFVETVKKKTGIAVEVIDGMYEAKLIYLGVKKALRLSGNEKVLCIDIGGGSTELILGEGDKTIFADSIKIGAVRLSKKFFPSFLLSEKKIKTCTEYIEEQILLSEQVDFNANFGKVVGTSGTIQSLAGLISSRQSRKIPKKLNMFEISRSDFNTVLSDMLTHTTAEDRLLLPGIEPKRADILPAGLLILDALFRLFNFKHLYISEYALREGIIIEMMENKKEKEFKL